MQRKPLSEYSDLARFFFSYCMIQVHKSNNGEFTDSLHTITYSGEEPGPGGLVQDCPISGAEITDVLKQLHSVGAPMVEKIPPEHLKALNVTAFPSATLCAHQQQCL